LQKRFVSTEQFQELPRKFDVHERAIMQNFSRSVESDPFSLQVIAAWPLVNRTLDFFMATDRVWRTRLVVIRLRLLKDQSVCFGVERVGKPD